MCFGRIVFIQMAHLKHSTDWNCRHLVVFGVGWRLLVDWVQNPYFLTSNMDRNSSSPYSQAGDW
jgi:hypothetical protein